MKTRFQFKNTALLMAMAAVYPLHAFGAAGTIQFTTGDVKYRRGATTDSVARGSALESGDAIETGANGRAQIRFTDGGMVSLQPNSQFNISRYVDANDPKQDAFLVDLLRGGMRAITGLIGKRNRENYKVTTSTATVGIRGSAFSIVYLPDGTLAISTEQDAIEVCTKAGCTGLTAGESVRVVSPDREPVRTSTRATLPTPEPTRDPVTVGDEVKGDSTASAVPPKPSTPSPSPSPSPAPATVKLYTGMAMTSAGVLPSAQASIIGSTLSSGAARLDSRLYTDGTLVQDIASGKYTSYVAGKDGGGTVLSGSKAVNNNVTGSATIVSETGSLASGNLLILGTWTGSTWTEGATGSTVSTLVSTTGFVTGQPTPSTALSSLSGIRGEYNLANATSVFATNGVTGSVLSSSKLTLDFFGAGNYADLNLDVRMSDTPTETITASVASMPGDLKFRGAGTLIGTTGGFGGGLQITSQNCVNSPNSVACGVGTFNGFVAGPNGTQAGVSFGGSYGTYGTIGGAATFTQATTSSTPSGVTLSPGSLYGVFIDGGSTLLSNTGNTSNLGRIFGQNSSSSTATISAGASFNGSQLTRFGDTNATNSVIASSTLTNFSGGLQFDKTGTTQSTFGAVGSPTESDFIGWGYWATGTRKDSPYNFGSNSTNLDHVHYLVGKPSSFMPSGGIAGYSLIGGTAPTATNGSTTQVGQLVSGSLNVNFSTSTIGLNIVTQFGTQQVSINYTGSESAPNRIYRNGSTFFSCGSGASINGFFTGYMASRAGLVYQTIDGTLGRVSGAAAFGRTSSTNLVTAF